MVSVGQVGGVCSKLLENCVPSSTHGPPNLLVFVTGFGSNSKSYGRINPYASPNLVLRDSGKREAQAKTRPYNLSLPRTGFGRGLHCSTTTRDVEGSGQQALDPAGGCRLQAMAQHGRFHPAFGGYS